MSIVEIGVFAVWGAGYFVLMFLTRGRDSGQPNPVIGLGYPMATIFPLMALIGWLNQITGGAP